MESTSHTWRLTVRMYTTATEEAEDGEGHLNLAGGGWDGSKFAQWVFVFVVVVFLLVLDHARASLHTYTSAGVQRHPEWEGEARLEEAAKLCCSSSAWRL